MSQTPLGVLVMLLSLSTAAGGGYLVRRADAIPAPAAPAGRMVTGTVVQILANPCGTGNRRATCYRPVIEYADEGEMRQLATRSGYRTSSPHQKGATVPVFVETGGEAWLASEFQARQERAQQDYESKRRFPWLMGWLLRGCGAFGVLLGLGLVFFVDRGGEQAT